MRLERARRRANERDRFELTHPFVLMVEVRHRAIERRRIDIAKAGADARTKARDERVRVASAAVEPQRDVEALGLHLREKRVERALVLPGILRRADAAHRR